VEVAPEALQSHDGKYTGKYDVNFSSYAPHHQKLVTTAAAGNSGQAH